jgi:hypothetical protein
MIYNIKYNSQRNNCSFSGKFKGNWQCFTTSAWMFMSYYSDKIDAEDDKRLAKYFDDVEKNVGKRGLAEKFFNWIKRGSSYWGVVQEAGITKWLNKNGVEGKAEFTDRKYDFERLIEFLSDGPVVLCTKKLGGLRKGHVILVVGYDFDRDIYYCHDPFGDATTKYKIKNGNKVEYPFIYLKKYSGKKIRCIRWLKK